MRTDNVTRPSGGSDNMVKAGEGIRINRKRCKQTIDEIRTIIVDAKMLYN